MPGGRPTKYNKAKALIICELISTSSMSLKTICEREDVNIVMSTVFLWLVSNKEFSDMYAKAKEQQADFLAEEIISIADDGRNDTMETEFGIKENKEWTSRSRLRVDARKWVAAKLKPRKYGDRLELDGGLDVTNQITPEMISAIASKINANANSR